MFKVKERVGCESFTPDVAETDLPVTFENNTCGFLLSNGPMRCSLYGIALQACLQNGPRTERAPFRGAIETILT